MQLNDQRFGIRGSWCNSGLRHAVDQLHVNNNSNAATATCEQQTGVSTAMHIGLGLLIEARRAENKLTAIRS